jgi:hypothetical protein
MKGCDVREENELRGEISRPDIAVDVGVLRASVEDALMVDDESVAVREHYI